MALKDQPYFPFYVKDFDSDEKLKECDAEAHGVYIRIMCLMHKSKTYGKILLEQKYQQTTQQNSSTCSDFANQFAHKLVRHLPFTLPEIQRGLCQLIENEVLHVDGLYLCQKRMMKDGDISDKRASAGKKSASGNGGKNNLPGFVATKSPTNPPTTTPTNPLAKQQQNTAIAIAIEYQDNKGGIDITEGVQGDENLGGEEGDEEIDHYIGNWHLETKIENCLIYYSTHGDFGNDRNSDVELFGKQYVFLKPEQIPDKLKLWGERFNDLKRGEFPEMVMRGKGSWVAWFHNWLGTQDLKSDPTLGKKNRFSGLENGKKEEKSQHKTVDQILRERGML